ncbi:vacuolar protein sorting-associated protein [Anaeramoeba ignava]|uniref:Vacuolar protein sorting-associated protein 29 n=1 Tax=Anaeramoeba ignava TaxID=1746090 RepID=A0A9Q0LWX2_ANAIG|nr:vacuolar protein sorting-associated protein [Anaeramoeba ignava]
MIVLIIGDIHIPYKSSEIPEKFKNLFQQGKIDYLICTGNLTTKSTLDYLKTITKEIYIARGDSDDDELGFELENSLQIESFKIGLIHGHQVVPWDDSKTLSIFQKKMGTDILIYGNTHESKVFKLEEKLYINPGSLTGAYHPTQLDTIPSFVVLDIQKDSLTSYIYKLKDGEVNVEKFTHKKEPLNN